MAKEEWLYCSDDWIDLINIIKMEKNPDERLREFHEMLKRDEMTIEDVVDGWSIAEKDDIESYAQEWFYDHDSNDATVLGSIIYWFFNVYTGEALHIKYSMTISCSGIIKD